MTTTEISVQSTFVLLLNYIPQVLQYTSDANFTKLEFHGPYILASLTNILATLQNFVDRHASFLKEIIKAMCRVQTYK